MEKTIGRLLEIEEEAKNIINRANDEKSKLHENFNNELAFMEKEINETNEKKINDFKIEIDQQLKDEENSLMLKNNKQLSELDEAYRKSHDTYVNKVFESILHSL